MKAEPILTTCKDECDAINEEMLSRAVNAAGQYAYGVVAVEVWVLNDRENLLYRPDGGWWRDPVFQPSEALLQLEDPTRPDYIPPHQLGPQEGLAGALWSEVDNFRKLTLGERRSLLRRRGRALVGNISRRALMEAEKFDEVGGPLQLNLDLRKVAWRDINALSLDPDQPPNPRLELLGNAGFGLAAGVCFNIRGHKGIVVYMARRTVNLTRLQSPTNESYMLHATDLIGAESALENSRKVSIQARQRDKQAAIKRAKHKLKFIARTTGKFKGIDLGESLQEDVTKEELFEDGFVGNRISFRSRFKCWAKKSMGLDVQPPPGMPLRQAIWTFIGVFTTLLILSLVSVSIRSATDGTYVILLGPFGALMTLQYSLTGAPASQPRNALYGQLLSMTIALAFAYIPDALLPPWLRLALVPAIAISAMAKLGITHPPAGASSLLFSFGGYNWGYFGLVLVGCVISIVMATGINNLSQRRQYPTYWAFFPARWKCERLKRHPREDLGTKEQELTSIHTE